MDYKDNWQENMNLLRFGLSNDQSFYELRRGLSQIDNSKLVSELKGDDIKRYKEAYDDIEKLYIEFQKKESVEVREKLRKRLDEIATVHKIDIQNYDENARYNKYQGQPLDEIPTTHQQSTIKPLVHEDEAFKKYKQVYVTNDNDLNKAILHYEKSKNVAIDTETARYILPHDAHTRLVQLHDPDTDVVHIIDMDKINDPKVLSHLMRKTKSNLVFQNASYDLAFLTKAGILKESDIEDKGFTDRIFDTMHVSRSIDAERDKHDLSSIASRVLGVNLTKKTDHDWASSKLRKSQIKYAAYDVIATGQIFKTMMQKNPKVASITNLFMGDISKNFKANLSRYMGLDTRTLTVIDNGVKKQMKMNDVLNFAGESIRGNKNRQIFLPDVPVAAFDKQMRSGGYSIYDLNNRVRYGSFAPDSLNKINSEILGKGGLNVKSGTRIKHNDLYNLMLLRVFSHGKSNIGESDAILSNLDDYSSDFGVKIIEDKNKQAYKLRTAIQDYMIDPRGPQDPAKGVNTLKKFEFVERLISGQRTSLRGLSPTKVNKIVDAIQGSYLKLFENPGNVTRLNKTVSPLGSASRGAQQRESLEKKGAIDISMFDPSLLPEDVREFFPAVDKFSASYTGTPHKFALSYTNDDNKRILDFAAGTGYGEGDIENIKAIPISSTTGIKEPFITDPVLQNAGIWVNPKLHQSSIRNMVEDIEGYSPRVQDFIRSKLMPSANTDESGNVHSIDWNEFNNKYRRYGTLGKHLGTFQDLLFSMSRKRVSAHDTWWNMIPKEHNTERYADSELGKRVFYEEKLRYLLGRSSYKYVRDQFEGIKYSSMLFDTLEEYSKFKDHNVNIYNQGVKAFFKTVTNKAVPEFRGDKPAPGSLSSIFLRAMNQGGKLKNFINSITEGRKSYGLDLGEVSSDPVGDFPKIIKNLGKEGLIRDDFTTDLSKGKESDILKTMTSGKFLGNAISHSITQFTQSNDKIAKFFPNVEGQNPVRFVDDSEKLVGKGSLTDSTLGLFAEGIPSNIHAEYGDDKFKIKKEVVEAEVQRLSNLFQKIDTGDINIDDFDWTKSTPHVKAMSRPDKIMEYVRRNTNFDPRYRGAITELAKKEYDGVWDIDEHIDNFARGMSLDKIAKKTTTGHNITLSDLKKYGITSFGFEIPGLTPGTRTGMYGSSGTHNSRLDVFKDIYRTVNNKLLSNLTESTRKNVDPNYIGKTGIFRSDVEMAETHGQTGIPIQWIRDLEYRLKGNTRFTTGKFNDLTSDKDKYKVEYKDTLSDLRNQLEDAKNRGNRNDIVSIRNKISNYKQAYKESLFKDKGEGLTTKENKQPMGEYGEEFTYTGDEFNEELQNRITGNVKEINNLSILPKRYSDKPTSIHSRFLSGLYNYFSPGIFPRRSKLPFKAPEPKGYSVLHPSNYPWLPKLSHNDYVMTIPEQLEEFKPIPFQDLPDNTKFSKYDATRSLEEESRKRAKEGISYSGEILDNSLFSRLSKPMINSSLLIPLLQKFGMLSNLPYDVNEENIRGNYVSEISKIEDSENTGNKVNTHEQIQEKIIPGFNDGGKVSKYFSARPYLSYEQSHPDVDKAIGLMPTVLEKFFDKPELPMAFDITNDPQSDDGRYSPTMDYAQINLARLKNSFDIIGSTRHEIAHGRMQSNVAKHINTNYPGGVEKFMTEQIGLDNLLPYPNNVYNKTEQDNPLGAALTHDFYGTNNTKLGVAFGETFADLAGYHSSNEDGTTNVEQMVKNLKSRYQRYTWNSKSAPAFLEKIIRKNIEAFRNIGVFNRGGMVPIRYNAGETIFDPEDVSKIGINNLKKLNALSDVVNPFGGHKLEGEYTEGDKNFGYAEPGSFILDRDSSKDKPKGYTLGGEVDPNATVDSTYNNLVNRRESSSVNAINAILDTLHKTIYGDKQRGLPGRGFTDNPTDVAEFKLIMDNLTKQFTSGNLKFSLVNPTDITKNLSGVLTSNINQQDANFMKGLAGRAAGISGQLNVPKTDLSKFEAGIAASSDAVKKMDWKPKSYEFKQTPFTQYKSVVNFESQDDLNKWKQENINFLSQITGIKSSKQLNTLGDIKETVTQQGGQRPIYSASGSFLIPKTAVEAAKTQGFDFANYFTELNASYADKISPHEAPHVLSESSTTGKNIEGFEKLNTHLGAGERLLNWMGKHMQTLNWAAVSVSMTAMGINFSLTNIYKVLQNTITTILSSASNLQSMFTNYSYAKIFGKDFIDIDAQLNKMGVSAGNFVDAWKRSTAVTAVASTLMSGMASKILLNTNFVKGLMDAFDAVVNKVTAGTKGNTILDKLSDMMVGKDGNGGLIASLPTLVDGLTTLVGILTSVAGQKGLVTFLAALVPMMWVIQPFMSILAGGSLIFSTFGKAALASSAYVDTFAFATNRAYAGVVKLVLALSTIVLLWEAVGRVVNYVAGQMVIPTPSELLLGKGAGVNEFNGAASFVGKAVGFATGYTPAEVGDTGVIEGSGGPTEDKNLVAVSRHEAIVKEKAMESPTNRALVSAMNHDRPIKIKGFAEGTPMPSVSLPDSYVSDQRYQMNINNSILQSQADSAYNSNNFLSSAYGGSGAFHVIVDNQSQLQGLAGISNETTNNSNITNGGITSFPWPTFPDFKFDISSITDWLKDIWERLGELKDKFGGEPKQDTKQDEKTDEKTDEKDKTKPDENKQDTKTDEKTGEDTGVKQSDVDRTREELADKFNELDKITSEANQRIIDEATTKNAGGDFKGGETNFPSAPEAKPEAPSWWDTLKSGVGDVIKDPKAFAADRLKAGAEFAINPIDPLLFLTGFGTAKGKGASNDEAAKESAIGLVTSTALMMGAGALGLGGIVGAVGEYAVPAAPLFGAKTTGENLPNQLVNSRTNNLPAGLSDEELSAIRKDITNKATKTAIENTPVPDQILSLGSGGMGTYGNGLLINAVGNAKMQNFHDTFENFRQNDFVKGANDLGSKAVNLGINTLSLAGSIPGINAFTLPFLGIGAVAKAPTELSKVSEGMPGLGVGTLTSASGIYDWLNEHGAAKPAINAMNNMFPGMGNLASFATLEGNKYEAMSTPNQEEAMKDFADKIKEKAGFLSIFGVNVNDMSDAVVKGTESQIKQVDATNILTDSQTNMTDACKYIPNALTGVQEKFLDLTNVSSDVNLKMGDLANKTMGVALPDGTKAQIAFNNQSNATATSIDALSKYGISISTAKDGAVTFSSQINPASVATGKLASSINTNIPKINTLGTSALTGAASILNTISQYNAQISNLIKNNTGTISSNTGTNQPQQSTYPSGNGGGGTAEEYKKTFEWGVQGNESLYLVEKYIENNSDKFKGKTLSDIQTMLTTSRGSVSGTMEYDPVFAQQLMYILSNSPQVLALLGITTAQPESPSKKPGARASGGLVTGPGSETSDSIPTLLSDNEFVVNADATKKNYSTLTAINSGKAIGDTTGNQYALWKASQALQNTISKMHKTSSSVANIVGNNSGNSVNSVPVQSEAKIINITVPVTIQGNVMDESLITQLSNEVARVIGLVSRKW